MTTSTFFLEETELQINTDNGVMISFTSFLDPRGGSLSLTHVVVLVDFFVSQLTVFIETS